MSIRLAADSGQFMNPFDTKDVESLNEPLQKAFKVDAFLALSASMMAEGNQGLTQAERSIIARCVEEAYRRAGDEGTPVLEDFYDLLLEQPEAAARDIALRYERHVKGSFSFFNRRSNVALDAPMVNIDLHDLNSDMKVFGMLTALEQVRNRMYQNFAEKRTTWLFIDEVQSLFKHPAVIAYFESFWAEGRKFGLVATGLSQNASFMLGSDIGSTIDPQLRLPDAPQAVHRRPRPLGGDAQPLRRGGPLHRRRNQARRRPAGRRRRQDADHKRAAQGKRYDLLTTKPSEVNALGGGGRSAR